MNLHFSFYLSRLFLIIGVILPLSAKGDVSQELLTEQDIRKNYIEHPDSCLSLLDKAQLRQLKTDMPVFKLDILRAMCHEIKGNYPEKERCVRRLLEDDSVRLVPERKLSITVI